ncbi:MAG: methyltransferase domain-containing protein [Defluviitaleaceae bacterium]|nr:methyltransferase domain-containing protein [Defluviitaleaceae bacterium]
MKAEFDKIANSYDDWHSELIKGSGYGREYFLEYKVREVFNVLQRQKFMPRTILDFGCGVGDVVPFLKQYFPDARIYGTDISEESIAAAGAKDFHDVTFAALGDGLEQFDVKFDLIFVAGVLHHIPKNEHLSILKMIESRMTNDSRIFIFELNPNNPATRHVFSKYEKPVDKNANLLQSRYVKKLLEDAGFNTSRSFYTIFFPHFLRAFLPLEKYLSFVPLGAHYYVFGKR